MIGSLHIQTRIDERSSGSNLTIESATGFLIGLSRATLGHAPWCHHRPHRRRSSEPCERWRWIAAGSRAWLWADYPCHQIASGRSVPGTAPLFLNLNHGDGMANSDGSKVQRRLAAILAADVVGFSTL